MQLIERALLNADHGTEGAVFRFVAGYVTAAAWMRTFDSEGSTSSLFAFFLAVLLALRLGPAVFRKVIPFSQAAKAAWAERRQLAKRFDSYQWQKLFWMGLGIGAFAAQSQWQPRALMALTVGCVVSGGLGLVMWRYRSSQLAGPRETSGTVQLKSA